MKTVELLVNQGAIDAIQLKLASDEYIIEILVANDGRRNKTVQMFLNEAERRRRYLRNEANAELQNRIEALSKAIRLYYRRPDTFGEMLLNSYM